MTEPQAPDYWSSLLIQIRETRNWSQLQLSKELGVSRDTVSRWELEHKYPSLDNQMRIGELANALNVASVFGISQVVEASPFPMILTDQNDFILSASKISGFQSGKTVIEQTPKEEQENYKGFSEMVAQTGFWDKAGNIFEYKFDVNGEQKKAIIQSVGSRGHIFALVQKL
jgi:transcriptional regulator with XRE-family HTH domain